MVQNLRGYFIPYVITIKCIECMLEKIECSCMLQRPRLIKTKVEDLRGGKRMASCCPGGHLPPQATPWLRACIQCVIR